MTKTKSASSPAAPSAGRLWLFRLILIVGMPLATLAVLEGALRLFGFGYPPSFVLADTIAGRAVLRDNQDFTQRFFAPHLVRTPHSFAVDAEKPAGTYRILVLGESAAMGDPAPAFGFARILSVMLAARYPDRRFEVVNAGVTTINSHAVREIARDSLRLQPDLVIVYMGNNEVVGPYGVGTVFNPFTGNIGIIRAQLAAKSLRLGQMFDRLGRWAGANKGLPERWEGMTMFLGHEVRASDPGLQHVYAHFQRNLEDILASAENGGAKVILSTIGTNLKDCPPFGSQHRPGFSAEDEKKWRGQMDAGIAEETAGHGDAALRLYADAQAIDDTAADLAFRQGRLLYAQGRYDDAYAAFVRARDLDTLRFRADSTVNRLIRETATRHHGAGFGFVDVDEEFRKASPHGIPGDELLYEHVHMTFAGNYVIARALADAAVPYLGEAKGPLPSETEAGERLGLSEWHQAKILHDVLERFLRPPFLGQIDAEARKRRLQERMQALAPELAAERLPAMIADLTARGAKAPDWEMHENLAQILEAAGQGPAAIGEWRAVIERVPHYMEAHANLAKLLFRAGKGEAALAEFERARELRPYVSDSYNNIGAMYASQGKWPEAIRTYERALTIDPSSRDTLINLAMARAAQKNLDEARRLYQQASERPAYTAEAHYQLALCARALDLVGEAKDHCQSALAIEPRHVAAYRLLMELFKGTGQGQAAFAYAEDLLKKDPDHPLAHETAGEILEVKGQADDAAAHYEKAIASDPGLDDAYLALAALRRKQGRGRDAQAVLERGVAARPASQPMQQRLADFYMEIPDPARALAACRRIRERWPQDWMATTKLAFVLATAPDVHLRDGAEALTLAEEADRATGHRDPRVLNTLAAALAESKRFPEATVAAREAIQVAQAAGQSDLAARIDRQAARYTRGLTYENPATKK
jgi:tetratricopeptide (TPR) repeat protein